MMLVTGAAGLNGSAVINEFARHNEQVRALVRDRDKPPPSRPHRASK
jgi:uncharacterized protein YbjT (DUF2867 family)